MKGLFIVLVIVLFGYGFVGFVKSFVEIEGTELSNATYGDRELEQSQQMAAALQSQALLDRQEEGENEIFPARQAAAQATGVIAGVCGNAVVEIGEECDDGKFGSLTCTDVCTMNVCGDGWFYTYSFTLSPRPKNSEGEIEECDDGDNVGNNSCTNFCKKNRYFF